MADIRCARSRGHGGLACDVMGRGLPVVVGVLLYRAALMQVTDLACPRGGVNTALQPSGGAPCEQPARHVAKDRPRWCSSHRCPRVAPIARGVRSALRLTLDALRGEILSGAAVELH